MESVGERGMVYRSSNADLPQLKTASARMQDNHTPVPQRSPFPVASTVHADMNSSLAPVGEDLAGQISPCLR